MNRREWLAPGLVILAMLSISCTVPYVCYPASIVNGTDRPVDVRLRITEPGGAIETTTVTLPAGGSLERMVRGNPSELNIEASVVQGASEHSVRTWQHKLLVIESPAGLTLVPRNESPKESEK